MTEAERKEALRFRFVWNCIHNDRCVPTKKQIKHGVKLAQTEYHAIKVRGIVAQLPIVKPTATTDMKSLASELFLEDVKFFWTEAKYLGFGWFYFPYQWFEDISNFGKKHGIGVVRKLGPFWKSCNPEFKLRNLPWIISNWLTINYVPRRKKTNSHA